MKILLISVCFCLLVSCSEEQGQEQKNISNTINNEVASNNTVTSEPFVVTEDVAEVVEANEVGTDEEVAAKDTNDEPKALIGAIDDSGRVDPEKYEFSNAEKKLWMDKHLLNIDKSMRIHYEFVKTGSYEDGFVDDVYLDIIKINEDGTRDTMLDFFTEERKQKVSPSNVKGISSNPVTGIYLQGDVYEMDRLTGGYWKYFHRQIKIALSESNESEQITIDHAGQEYNAEKITIYPYEKIKNKDRLKEFFDKSYEFILSDDLPGKLYQIKTVMKDPENPEEPLMVEVLTLKNFE